MVDSYQLGPISAGADSPLGMLLAFGQQVSGNFQAGSAQAGGQYASGLNLAVNAPQSAQAAIFGKPVDPAVVAAAEAKGLSPSPFAQAGQILGGLFGTGVGTIGGVVGIGGQTAAPGVAAGASAGIGGIAQTAVAGLGGGLQGLFTGSIAGVGNALGVGDGSAVLILGGAALLILFLLLK